MIAARTIGGLIDASTIEEMESDLAKVIEDFDRAMNVEALRRIKETGERSFDSLSSLILNVSCRAGVSARPTEIRRDELSPGSLLYGRHPRNAP